MNYSEHYERLIEKRRKERPEGYTENHHAIPKCIGGLKTFENMVRLTAKEHFVAHLLLVKMYSENKGLNNAAFRMSGRKLYGSRKYVWVKEKWSKVMSEKFKGISLTEDQKDKISKNMKGVRKSEEHCKRMKVPKPLRSKEHCQRMSIVQKGRAQPLIICPYCSKSGGKSLMVRYHFENCKDKGDKNVRGNR